MRLSVTYYAVFNYDEYDPKEKKYGISILFPDVPEVSSCSRSYKEGLDMALEALELCLFDRETSNLPEATPPEKITLGENEQLVPIIFDREAIDFSQIIVFK